LSAALGGTRMSYGRAATRAAKSKLTRSIFEDTSGSTDSQLIRGDPWWLYMTSISTRQVAMYIQARLSLTSDSSCESGRP
jgi:hypothetical protein